MIGIEDSKKIVGTSIDKNFLQSKVNENLVNVSPKLPEKQIIFSEIPVDSKNKVYYTDPLIVI